MWEHNLKKQKQNLIKKFSQYAVFITFRGLILYIVAISRTGFVIISQRFVVNINVYRSPTLFHCHFRKADTISSVRKLRRRPLLFLHH